MTSPPPGPMPAHRSRDKIRADIIVSHFPLCAIGLHRYRWLFVGSDWQPNDYVKACTRCGRERM